MSELGSTSNSPLPVEVGFSDLCIQNVRSIKNLVNGEKLLNRRQCRDLSSKLLQTTLNIQQLLLYCGAPIGLFRLALEKLYRYLDKAKVHVSSCAEEGWLKNINEEVYQCKLATFMHTDIV